MWLAYIGPGVGPEFSLTRVLLDVLLNGLEDLVLLFPWALLFAMAMLLLGRLLSALGSRIYALESPACLRAAPQRPWPPGAR